MWNLFFVLVPDVLCGRIWNFREPSSLCDIPATLNHPNKTIFFGRVVLASGSLRYSHEKCNNNVDVYSTESFVKRRLIETRADYIMLLTFFGHKYRKIGKIKVQTKHSHEVR